MQFATAFARGKVGTYKPIDRGLAGLVNEPPSGHFFLPIGSMPDELKDFTLPRESIVIRGENQLGRIAIKMLAQARTISPHSETIYMTFNGARNFLANTAPLNQWWRHAVRHALQQGWDVCQIIRLDSSLRRSIALVDTFRMYLGTRGTYLPYYVKSYGTLDVPEGLLAVPGIGALILYATKQAEYVDAAIYIPDRGVGHDQIALLVEHVERFRLTSGVLEHLLKAYPLTHNALAFSEKLAEYEALSKNIITFKRGIPVSARYPKFLEVGSTWRDSRPSGEGERSAEISRIRINLLHDQVKICSRRTICSLQAIAEFVEKGVPSKDDSQLVRGMSLLHYTPQERFDQIHHLIGLLKVYGNYKLALFDDTAHPDLADSFFWEAFQGAAVMLESWRPTEDGEVEQIDLEITEQKIADAFYAYGDKIWNRDLEPQARDKHWVIWRLEQFKTWLVEHYPDEITSEEGDA